jgi:hypothetical protein
MWRRITIKAAQSIELAAPVSSTFGQTSATASPGVRGRLHGPEQSVLGQRVGGDDRRTPGLASSKPISPAWRATMLLGRVFADDHDRGQGRDGADGDVLGEASEAEVQRPQARADHDRGERHQRDGQVWCRRHASVGAQQPARRAGPRKAIALATTLGAGHARHHRAASGRAPSRRDSRWALPYEGRLPERMRGARR